MFICFKFCKHYLNNEGTFYEMFIYLFALIILHISERGRVYLLENLLSTGSFLDVSSNTGHVTQTDMSEFDGVPSQWLNV